MLTPGIYKSVVEKHWLTTSQVGNPGLSIKVKIDDDWDSGQTFIGTIWFTEKSMGMARGQLRALGFDMDANELADLEDTISLVGVKVDVELKEEVYNGRSELRIARFGGPAPPPTKAALAAATKALRSVKKSPANSDTVSPAKQKTMGDAMKEVDAAIADAKAMEDKFPWEIDDTPPTTEPEKEIQ